MQEAAKEPLEGAKKPSWKIQSKQDLAKIDIAAIGGTAFKQHIRSKDSETFITSLYEINQITNHKRAEQLYKEEEELQTKVPAYYHDYLDVFSKERSDKYPPSCPNNFRIKLESEPNLGYCPLYCMSLEELEAAKQYIMENLNKGFIKASKAPYTSPILMAKKPGGGLHFCVDYWKLNAVTKKN